MSFIRRSRSRKASSAATAASAPQRRALGVEQVGRPGRARRRSAGRPRRSSRPAPSTDELVEDRLDVVGRRRAARRRAPWSGAKPLIAMTRRQSLGRHLAGRRGSGRRLGRDPSPRRRSRSRARRPSRAGSAPPGRPRSTPGSRPRRPRRSSPSIVMTSPARSVRSPTTTRPSWTSSPAAPTTAGMPQPRATTAAWLARPPRAVRIPAARAIPWTSSGEVSARTRIVGGPASAAAWAASGSSRSGRWRSRARPAARSRAARLDRCSQARRAVGGWARSGSDPLDRLGPGQRERRVLGHVDRDPEGGLRAALADPDLEHPEAAVLDRELDVAQVGVVALEPVGRGRAGRPRPPAGARRGPRSARSDASRRRRPRPGRRTSRRRTAPARRSPGCA